MSQLTKLIAAQLVKKFPPFYRPQNLLLCSQKSVTGPYSKTHKSRRQFSMRFILTFSSLWLGPSGLFPSGFPTKVLIADTLE